MQIERIAYDGTCECGTRGLSSPLLFPLVPDGSPPHSVSLCNPDQSAGRRFRFRNLLAGDQSERNRPARVGSRVVAAQKRDMLFTFPMPQIEPDTQNRLPRKIHEQRLVALPIFIHRSTALCVSHSRFTTNRCRLFRSWFRFVFYLYKLKLFLGKEKYRIYRQSVVLL